MMRRRFDEIIRPIERCRFCHKYIGHCRCRVRADDPQNLGVDVTPERGAFEPRRGFSSHASEGRATASESSPNAITASASRWRVENRDSRLTQLQLHGSSVAAAREGSIEGSAYKAGRKSALRASNSVATSNTEGSALGTSPLSDLDSPIFRTPISVRGDDA